jgi:hypothetical protein
MQQTKTELRTLVSTKKEKITSKYSLLETTVLLLTVSI